MDIVIKEAVVGKVLVSGTEWPRVAQLVRRQYGSNRATFAVQVLCNGVCHQYQEFKTRREAAQNFAGFMEAYPNAVLLSWVVEQE